MKTSRKRANSGFDDLDIAEAELDNSNNDTSTIIGDLSKKKMEYQEQEIQDKSGKYNYDDDPIMYKKARKRLQNRESAVRSRTKKKEELEVLQAQISKLKEENATVV